MCEARAPNTVLHTKQDTTHFFFDGDMIKADNHFFRHGLQDHGLQGSLTGTPETPESHEENKTTHGSQNNLRDWIRYILYTGADEHGNQTVQK